MTDPKTSRHATERETEESRELTIIDNLDILPEDLDRRIQRTKMQIEALERLMKTVLTPGVDYDTIPGTPKPTLLQDGAHQICLTFHLQPEFHIEDKTEDRTANPPFLAYFCRCRLYHRPSGMLVAEGIGSANSYESRYRYRWVEAPPEEQQRWQELKDLPNYRSRKINNRWVLQRRVENPDIYDLQNTLVKMAKKRAYVDATLNATGASRLFTQDLEDIGHIVAEEQAGEAPPPEQGQQRPQQQGQKTTNGHTKTRNGNGGGKATQAQLSKIYAMTRGLGIDKETIRAISLDKFGKESSTQLTKAEASELIEYLQAMENGEVVWPGPEDDMPPEEPPIDDIPPEDEQRGLFDGQ